MDRGVVVLETTGEPGRVEGPRRAVRSRLRSWLVTIDIVAAVVGWTVATVAHGPVGLARWGQALSLGTGIAAVTIAAIAAHRLYLTRVCAIRTVEISRLLKATAVAAVAALLAPRALPVTLSVEAAALGSTLTFGLLLIGRGAFRQWLHMRRRDGRYTRRVVIIGANEDGYDLFKLVEDHPEAGLEVVGVIGTGGAQYFPARVRMLGSVEGAVEATAGAGATGALIAATALRPRQINETVRALHRAGVHVQISSGLRGLDCRRFRQQPLAHEPLFYVEPVSLGRWQRVAKRGLDIVVAGVGAVASLPVLALAAAAIKLEDGGPVLYRQTRPGQFEAPFTIFKLRTMSVGADRLEPDRVDEKMGPRAKVDDDPRRTRVGRILERASVDELPQLWNVLRGDMSLVGPRPALAHEAAKFDDELKARYLVPPGITGLWQVEARDNPSFSAYRRYDLFYIENWSLLLDIAILAGTAQRVLLRALGAAVRRREPQQAPLVVLPGHSTAT